MSPSHRGVQVSPQADGGADSKAMTVTPEISYFYRDMNWRIRRTGLCPSSAAMASQNGGGRGADDDDDEEEEEFRIQQINDFTQEELKSELSAFEDTHELAWSAVCAGVHGGPLDYPKVATAAVVNVVEKWDLCYKKLERVIDHRRPPPPATHATNVKNHSGASADAAANNSDEEVYEQLTGDALKSRSVTASSFFADLSVAAEVSEEEFHAAVTESASKIYLQSIRLCKALLDREDANALHTLVGAMALVRNKLWHYDEHLQVFEKPRAFNEQYQEFSNLMDSTVEQLMELYSGTVATNVLHDPISQDWANHRAFYEGEKISHCIQVWWYFLQGLQRDLWQTLPPKVAQKLFAGVFTDSLGILATRYSTCTGQGPIVEMAPERVDQYVADISSILLVSVELLPVFAGSVSDLFLTGDPTEDRVCRDIHAKCSLLMIALAVIGAPIKLLGEILEQKQKRKSKKSKHFKGSSKEKQTVWMNLIRPEIFPESPDKLSVQARQGLLAKIVAGSAEPNWALLVQLMTGGQMMVAKLILMHFGAFVPGGDNKSVRHAQVANGASIRINGDIALNAAAAKKATAGMMSKCSSYGCRRGCVGRADAFWPQAVGTAVLRVGPSMCNSSKAKKSALPTSKPVFVIIKTPKSLLKKLSKSSWEALDRQSLGSLNRPVYFEAIIQLLEPFLWPVLQELFNMISAGKAWTKNHVAQAMREVIVSIQEIVPVMPISVLSLCSHLDERKPQGVKPLANCVLTHLCVSSLVGTLTRMIPELRQRRLARERLDFLVTFTETLCRLEISAELLKIQDIASETLSDGTTTDNQILDDPELDLPAAAELVASHLLTEGLEQRGEDDREGGGGVGAFAMKVLHKFVCYNADWIQTCLIAGKESNNSPDVPGEILGLGGEILVLIRPWGLEAHPEPNPQDMMSRIGAFQLSLAPGVEGGGDDVVGRAVAQSSVLCIDHPWETYLSRTVTQDGAYDNTLLVARLLQRRPELNDEVAAAADAAAAAAATRDAWAAKVAQMAA